MRLHGRVFVETLLCAMTSHVLAQVEPKAGTWKTWVLTNGQELRFTSSGIQEASVGEIAWLKSYINESSQSAEAMRQMRYWLAGPLTYRWVETMLSNIDRRGFTNPKNARAIAMMNIAVYDATVAAWDSKYTYNRARPAQVDPALPTAVETPASPSYPAEHAVTAGAASEILAYLFPQDSQSLRNLGDEAARAAITAGINYPSDVAAGLQLGRAIGAKVIANGAERWLAGCLVRNRSDRRRDVGRDESLGAARRNMEDMGAQFGQSATRPGPPIPYDSPLKRAELDEIKNYQRAFASNQKCFYYQSLSGLSEPVCCPDPIESARWAFSIPVCR